MTKTEIIKARFEKQGGSGWRTEMFAAGCYCAVGALVADKIPGATNAVCWQTYDKLGGDMSTLMLCHDAAIKSAYDRDGYVVERIEIGQRSRVLFGTPAWDHFWSTFTTQMKEILA